MANLSRNAPVRATRLSGEGHWHHQSNVQQSERKTTDDTQSDSVHGHRLRIEGSILVLSSNNANPFFNAPN